MSSVLRDLGGCYAIVPPYQDSTGRNDDAGGPASPGFRSTYDFVDGAGLSGRACVLDEPARLQPRVVRVATNRMSVHQRMGMLNLFTSSPEAEFTGNTTPAPSETRQLEWRPHHPKRVSTSESYIRARGIALHEGATYVSKRLICPHGI